MRMPRYFFHSQDGVLTLDVEGTELADNAAAKVEAVGLMGALIKDQPEEFWSTQSLKLMVTGGRGELLFALDLSAVETPVIMAPG